MKVSKGKQAKLLPARSAMNDIAKSGRTIADYAKATPLGLAVPNANIIQNLRLKGK